MWLKIDDNEKRPNKLINLDKIVSIETRIGDERIYVFARYDATAGYEFSDKAGDVYLASFKDINESDCFIAELQDSIAKERKVESLERLIYRAEYEYQRL